MFGVLYFKKFTYLRIHISLSVRVSICGEHECSIKVRPRDFEFLVLNLSIEEMIIGSAFRFHVSWNQFPFIVPRVQR